ncbi:hypothetical protein [Endozoicomonas acroporae]|uniref:hypothetical protein n=1 Tax=Endozoicomonas acroporae TaxID=1701104 RepID=UPI0013D8057A|nr:hypothetical protein [Endozoicomonas acroporae]
MPTIAAWPAGYQLPGQLQKKTLTHQKSGNLCSIILCVPHCLPSEVIFMDSSVKSNMASNIQQTVYLGDPSRISGGRPVSVFSRIRQLINPMNWLSLRTGSNRYSDYQKASSNLVKSLNNYHEIKSAATNVLYLTIDEHSGDINHKIKQELNSMKPAIYRRLELTGNDSASSISNTDNDSNADNKPDQEITMSDQELEKELDNNTSILNKFEDLIKIIECRKSVSPEPGDGSQARASTRTLEDEIDTAIDELASTCMQTRKTIRHNLNTQLAFKEKILINSILRVNPELHAIDNFINQKIEGSSITSQYSQKIARLNISWNILLHILGLDTEALAVRFTELDTLKDLIFHSLNASSIREGKDGGISRFFTRFMSQEDGDINSPSRAERVKEIMTLEASISSGKLQPIMLDGHKITEPVETSGIDFTGSTTLLNNEIYNFKRAILYPAYGCHKAQLEGKAQEEKDCLHVMTLSCLAYFFRMIRAEWSESQTSHADAAIRIIEFIQSIKSDQLSLLFGPKYYPFENIEQLNKHFSEFYHKYCSGPSYGRH